MAGSRPSRALLLDLDGTLADSLGGLRAAYDAMLASFGAQGTDEGFRAVNGPPLAEGARRIVALHGLDASPEQVAERWWACVRSASPSSRPRAGARELLEAAAHRGWRRCLVTSSTRALAERWLREHDLDGLVPDRVCAEDTRAGKPDPAPYLAALVRTGADAGASLAVEDSFQGASSALGARVDTWQLGGDPLAPGAHRLVRLADLLPLLGDSS